MTRSLLNKFTQSFFILLVYIPFTILAFEKLPRTFFQQDEWLIFGNYFFWDLSHWNWWQRLFIYEQAERTLSTHIVPLSIIVSYVEYWLFRLNFLLYALAAIGVQLVNAILVYWLSLILTKKKTISFISGLLFLLNSISHQGFTWMATVVGTAGSTFTMLLFLIFLSKYVFDKSRLGYIILGVVCLAASFLFKETSFFIFLFIFVFWLAYKERKLEGLKKMVFVFSAFTFSYFIFRLLFLLGGTVKVISSGSTSGFEFGTYLYRIITLPFKFIAQGIIPVDLIVIMARYLIFFSYPQYMLYIEGGNANPYILETVAADIISYLLAIIILIFSAFIFKVYLKKREVGLAKTIVVSLFFIGLSSLPFVMIPGRAGNISLIDGRHLYLTGIFSSLLLALFIYGLYVFFKKTKRVFIVCFLIVLILVFGHIKKIRSDIRRLVSLASTRERILNTIQQKYPKLSQDVVFYIDSDRAYYGLTENDKILPFQSGFGQTLLVWYGAHQETFPACFFANQYLFYWTSQGYKECGGRGFGYFREKDAFLNAVKESSIKEESIIAFHYVSSEDKLFDVTESIREEVKKYYLLLK